VSALLGTSLGPLIPSDRYDTVGLRMLALERVLPYKIAVFHMGWCGLGYRAAGAAEHFVSFKAAFPAGRPASSREAFEQDRDFVDFVSNSCAAGESLLFAINAIASISHPQAFPLAFSSDLRISYGDVAQRLVATFPAQPLTATMRGALDSKACKGLFAARDVVLHRGRLPRQLFLSPERPSRLTVPTNPKDIPGAWDFDTTLEAQALDSWYDWLRGLIDRALDDLLPFVLAAETSAPRPGAT